MLTGTLQRAIDAFRSAVLLSLFVVSSSLAQAQVDDHLTCYSIKDPVKLRGIVDISAFGFPPELGCTISKTELFCAPSSETVREASDKGNPIGLGAIAGQALVDDRVCYRITCAEPYPDDQEVTDQFGTRRLGRLRPSMLCTPAVKGSEPPATPPQANDHLKCYRITDPVKLRGIVDINVPQFPAELGCKISKAKLFCAPASKTVKEASDAGNPIDLFPLGGQALVDDRVCYRIKCAAPSPGAQEVTDQFGTRTLGELKPSMICTPAVKGIPGTTTIMSPSSTTTTLPVTTTTLSSTTTTTTTINVTTTTLGEPECRVDADCPPQEYCDPCGSSSCPHCVPACRPHGCPTEDVAVCLMIRPECEEGQVAIIQGGCWICVDMETCEPPPANECTVPADCLDKEWLVDCMGHWDCRDGRCREVCDFETCGDGVCDSAGGESRQSCYPDCRDTRCDDGTVPVCMIPVPQCTAWEILAYQNHCYRCVNPETCVPWGEPGCKSDADCPPEAWCDPCGSSSCPVCDNCVPACTPHRCPTEDEPVCDMVRPDCGEGQVAVVRDGCWVCVDRGTCVPPVPVTPCGAGGSCGASEICVVFGPVGPGGYSQTCQPVPVGCELDHTCGCVSAALCPAPHVCWDLERPGDVILCQCTVCV